MMCADPNPYDPYAPTRFTEANAILLAGMSDGGDDEAEHQLLQLVLGMSEKEREVLAGAARELLAVINRVERDTVTARRRAAGHG